MELFEVLNAFCTRRSGAVSDSDKRKYAYMIRRLFSAQFPMLCECVNRLDSDPLYTANLISMATVRYNGLPSYLKKKINQKKKKETIRTKYEDWVLNKYMEINECGIREVEEAYEFNSDEIIKSLDLIKKNFTDPNGKCVNDVIIRKSKSKKKDKEDKLF
ncbi:MAG: hypothetical protein NC548_21250 [Lachnospiraceae bacterium]|nr:hypothetical protein [Lachnospiraceae bacterium]